MSQDTFENEIDDENEIDENSDSESDAIWAERKLYEPRIDEGWHKATVKEVEQKLNQLTPWGYKDNAILTFQVGEIPLKKWCTLSLSKRSTLYSIVSTIIGYDPGNRYNLRELIGKACEVFVSHKQNDSGDVYETIKEVRAVRA
jgi:hypothetical protein